MSAATALQNPATRLSRAPRAIPKGLQTRAAILDTALGLASQRGLESLSMGELAQAMGMSKSGVFVHFGSREELQISVVHEYHRRFQQEVFEPALAQPRGLPRLRALMTHWMQRASREAQLGCLHIVGAVEFNDRPGPVRAALLESVMAWRAALKRAIAAARQQGHLPADVDAGQLVFELQGLVLSLHHEARFLRSRGALAHARRGLEHILSRHGAVAPARRIACAALP